MNEEKMEHELDILAQTKFKNLRLWDLKGSKKWSQVAAEAGVGYGRLLDLLSFRLSPMDSKGEWRESVRRLSEYFAVGIEELFPISAYKVMLPIGGKAEKTFASMEFLSLPEAQGRGLLPAKLDMEEEIVNGIEKKLLMEKVSEILEKLPADRREVINERFGFNDTGEVKSLEFVGEKIGKSRERVRQIEATAIRKLRHPANARLLRRFVGSGDLSYLVMSASEIKERIPKRGQDKSHRMGVLAFRVLSYPLGVLPGTFEAFLGSRFVQESGFDVDALKKVYKGYRRWVGILETDDMFGQGRWRYLGRRDLLDLLNINLGVTLTKKKKRRKRAKSTVHKQESNR